MSLSIPCKQHLHKIQVSLFTELKRTSQQPLDLGRVDSNIPISQIRRLRFRALQLHSRTAAILQFSQDNVTLFPPDHPDANTKRKKLQKKNIFISKNCNHQQTTDPLSSAYKKGWVLKNCCFWTVVLEKTLESPWIARRANQSIPKEISPEYSLEGLMLKLKLPYFGHLMQGADSLEKTLMLGKTEGRRRRGWQRTVRLDGNTDSMDVSLCELRQMVRDRETWHAADHGVTKSQTDWMTEQRYFILQSQCYLNMHFIRLLNGCRLSIF